jgi:hypothetical protein
MFNIDEKPKTDEDVSVLFKLVLLQQTQLISIRGIIVTCYCGRTINVNYAFRCFYCGLYFCRICAARHFKNNMEV